MNRREVIAGLSCLALFDPAMAQTPARARRIAIATTLNRPGPEAIGGHPFYGPFLQELEKRGFVESKNVVLEWWPAEGRFERFGEIAAGVVDSNPDVILVASPEFARHFKAATSTVPVVAFVNDAIVDGFVTNLSRPGGNITGFSSSFGFATTGKRFELLKELLPGAARLAYLAPKSVSGSRIERATKDAAQLAGIVLIPSYLDSPVDEASYRRTFDTLQGENVDAILVSGATENFNNVRTIVRLAEEKRIPTIYVSTGATALGGLIASYPDTPAEQGRFAADYVDRILKGAKPGDLPFHQPTSFKVSINLKTASALGLTIPVSLLARADEVIE